MPNSANYLLGGFLGSAMLVVSFFIFFFIGRWIDEHYRDDSAGITPAPMNSFCLDLTTGRACEDGPTMTSEHDFGSDQISI